MLKETLWHEIDALPESQLKTLREFVQFLQYMAQQKPATPKLSRRIPGLDAGSTWVSDDFDAPLPDSFWFGDDVNDEAPA
ncbi:MAG: DUF2281 domain-containing protein [Anaerolineae bacterium]|nr:DUF2281 domain-containing protein [Anaerolineae bacterium]